MEINSQSEASFGDELSLTKQELEEFRKLPKEEQERQKDEKLLELQRLNDKLDEAMQEAIKTGHLDEAIKLKEQLEKEVNDLKEKVEMSEMSEQPELKFEWSKEITPDPEITSAETAITKLENDGFVISDNAKDLLNKVNWSEKLKSSYEVVSLSVSNLFNDEISHTFGEIKIKAQELGLDLIPQALVPTIRLNSYDNSNVDEWIAMALKESIINQDHDPRIFQCYRSSWDSPWLKELNGHDDNEWAPHYQFFFVR